MNASPMREELYDLAKDPDELRDLAAATRHQKQLLAMRERWKELADACK
jgi:arylsulfatase A-like enzyme